MLKLESRTSAKKELVKKEKPNKTNNFFNMNKEKSSKTAKFTQLLKCLNENQDSTTNKPDASRKRHYDAISQASNGQSDHEELKISDSEVGTAITVPGTVSILTFCFTYITKFVLAVKHFFGIYLLLEVVLIFTMSLSF